MARTSPFTFSATIAGFQRTALLSAFGLVLLLSWLIRPGFAANPDEHPHPELSPQQVVRIILDSLQSNDDSTDSGIATVFRFASPANKANTGPLPRFRNMIHRSFPDMLNYSSVRFDTMEIRGDTALQAVWLTSIDGRETGYAFKLRKQRGGTYDGAWMTDAVFPLGPGSRNGLRI